MVCESAECFFFRLFRMCSYLFRSLCFCFASAFSVSLFPPFFLIIRTKKKSEEKKKEKR